jgi:hypothetical protein
MCATGEALPSAKFKSKPNPRLIIGKVKEAGSLAMVISREQG